MDNQQRHETAEFILSFDTFVIEVGDYENDYGGDYDFEIDDIYYKKMSFNDALECKELFLELDENLKLTCCDNEILQMRLEDCIEKLEKMKI